MQGSLNLSFCPPFLVIQGTKLSQIWVSRTHTPACLLWITTVWLKGATSLSSSSHTAPNHLVTSIFCSTLRGFCSHCHLDRQGELCKRRETTEHVLSRTLSQGCEMRKESLLTPPSSTDSIPVLFRSCWWLLTDLLLPPVKIYRATYSTGKIAKINFSCCLMLSMLFFWRGGRFLVQTNTIHLCSAMSCFPLQRGRKHLAAPAPITRPASCPPNLRILFTLRACTRAHTNTQQLPEILKLSLFHPMLNHVQWTEKKLHSLQRD